MALENKLVVCICPECASTTAYKLSEHTEDDIAGQACFYCGAAHLKSGMGIVDGASFLVRWKETNARPTDAEENPWKLVTNGNPFDFVKEFEIKNFGIYHQAYASIRDKINRCMRRKKPVSEGMLRNGIKGIITAIVEIRKLALAGIPKPIQEAKPASVVIKKSKKAKTVPEVAPAKVNIVLEAPPPASPTSPVSPVAEEKKPSNVAAAVVPVAEAEEPVKSVLKSTVSPTMKTYTISDVIKMIIEDTKFQTADEILSYLVTKQTKDSFDLLVAGKRM